MAKIISIILYSLLLINISYAVPPPDNLNNDVLSIKQQVDDIRSNLQQINIQLTELDHKTLRAEFNKSHPKEKSEFVVIHKIVLFILLFFFICIGVILSSLFKWRTHKP